MAFGQRAEELAAAGPCSGEVGSAAALEPGPPRAAAFAPGLLPPEREDGGGGGGAGAWGGPRAEGAGSGPGGSVLKGERANAALGPWQVPGAAS